MLLQSSNDHPITPSLKYGEKTPSTVQSTKKGARFWLIFGSMCICLFFSAFEFVSVPTALPTIANALHTTNFAWIGPAYVLSSIAFLPMSGGLAQVFGRRPAILITIGLFALGGGICGGANGINMLIAGRAIQGLGGGGIQSLTGIVLADLVTLKERGVYIGLFSLTWCLAASIGPVVAGSLAMQGQWHWLFYLDLPISLIAGTLVLFLLDQPAPTGSYRDKLMRMDWIGNFLVISSTVACTIGLMWGGITAPWGSATVLVPLVVGLSGFMAFIMYEAIIAKYPLVPVSLMTNITSISGYIQTFCSYVVTSAIICYFPVYFQACRGAPPISSGIYSLALASVGLAAIVTGVSVKVTGRYRPQIWLAWAITTTACGLMSTVRAASHLEISVGYLVLAGWGLGMLNTTSVYPIQAPLPVTQNAPAITFMWFLRMLASVWGITIGSTVLQNELTKELPLSFVRSIPEGTAAYTLIPELSTLAPPTRSEVQVAFANSLAVLWRVLTAISGAGLAASLFMRGIPLQNTLDMDEETDRLV